MRMIDRRTFVGGAAALVAGGMLHPQGGTASTTLEGQAAKRLPLGFSTLGCPKWDWLTTLDFAASHGYAAIELRGIQETVDLTKRPEFQPDRIAQTRRELADRRLVISDLGASTNLHEMDPSKREAGLAEARGFIDLASALKTPYVRVFGNKYLPDVPREQTLAHVAATLRTLGEYAKERNVVVLLETHGDFTDSATVLEIIHRADSAGAAILWDAHHTFAFGKESPETSVRELGPYIRHVHLKDSVVSGDDRRYVLTGKGDVPVRRQVAALVRMKYAGFYNFEWEKRWHPEIEEPEVAFPQFADVVGGYLRDAGVTPR
jgi:sugar phosphate isomerase/epimerase